MGLKVGIVQMDNRPVFPAIWKSRHVNLSFLETMETTMTRINAMFRHALMAIGVILLGLFTSNQAQAQNEASAAYNAYNSAFLVQQNGQTYYASTLASLGTAPEQEWQQALDIQVALDVYQYTHAQADRDFAISLLNSLAYYNGPGSMFGNWQTDGWDDNLAWMVNVFLRGYELTGISSYLTEAEAGWNNGYNQGWDTTAAGGGIWEERPQDTAKCALSNDPFVFEGVQLYLATGDSTYLTKAEAIYAWVRTHLVNTTSNSNSFGAPGQVNGCVGTNGQLLQLSDNVYDNGAFVKAAADLYRVTGNQMYYNDALLAINHIVGEGSVIPYDNSGESGHQWAYWFTRGLSDFATEANLWPQYQSWLQGNANAAWSERNNANITWNDWSNPTNDSGPDPNEMSSAAAIWQHLPPPSVNLSGTYEIQNVASGLAMNVKDASTANGAPIIQWPFSSGETNALWTFVPTSGGYYQIKNVNSGQVVNVQAVSGMNGASIVQWPAQGMIPGNDQWLPVQNPDGTYSFYNLNSLQALDDPNESIESGLQLDQWFGNSTPAQKFNLIPQ